jgi:hypothetical protein
VAGDDDERRRPAERRRPERGGSTSRSGATSRSARARTSHSDGDDSAESSGASNGKPDRIPATAAARRAAEQVVALTGRDFESVISIERTEDGWRIGVEVVETHRIPDSADILASFEVNVDRRGELSGYHRTRRYSRGQLQQGGR